MDYKRSIILLISGSSVAQVLPILVSPMLTRLYSPAEFGILGIYLGICAVLSVFAAGRYDMALIEPVKDSEARGLMFGGLWLTALFCVILGAGLMTVGPGLARLLDVPSTGSWLKFVPISVFCMSCSSIFTYWLNRRKNFKGMNAARILNAVGVVGLSLVLAFTQMQPIGLLLGHMCGQFLALVYQWFAYIRIEAKEDRIPILPLLRIYSRYPKFLIPSTLAGVVAAESPILLLTRFFDEKISGIFYFVNRVVVSPMSIISNTVAEVYRVRAAEHYNQKGQCRQLFLNHFLILALIGFFPWCVLFFYGVPFFTFVFGPEWKGAGEMATYLSFVVWFQLVSSPLSYTIMLNHSQHIDLYLQIFRVIGAIVSVFIGYAYGDYMLAVKIYSLTYCTYYLCHSFVQFQSAKGA